MVNTVKNGVYALVKYTILCTGETKMCKLTKNLPIYGYPVRLLDFQNSEGRILQGGKGKFRGLKPPLELCFGTSEMEWSASWSYIMSTFLLYY